MASYLTILPRGSRFALPAFLALSVCLPCIAKAQDEEGEEPLYRPGLIAHYANGGGAEAIRVDRMLAFNWRDESPDRRIPAGKFNAHWQGLLQTEGAGDYRLYVYAAGKIKIDLAGQTILAGEAERPQWIASKKVELPFGYYPLDIRYDKAEGDARLALYWTGPGFQLEPIGERYLVHKRDTAPDNRFERGEQLVRALRCAACHEIGGEPPLVAAPDLSHLKENISRAWLVEWLAQKGHEGEQGVRRMPGFGLDSDEAEAIVAWLFKSSVPPAASKGKEAGPARIDVPAVGDPKAGETLLLTAGCLACHRVGPLGESGLFGGGDLTHVGNKRPPEFFATWLADPGRLNKQHRMPVFDLTPKERAELAAHLEQLRAAKKVEEPAAGDDALADRGKVLFLQRGCQACHAPEGAAKDKSKRTPLSAKSRWGASCLGEPDAGKPRPGYQLSTTDAQAIVKFASTVAHVSPPETTQSDGRYLLAERNCLACHARGASQGLAPKLPAVAEARPELTSLVPAMTPPPLASVGDKLHDAALAEAITRRSGVHRPWLRVRMPKFEFSPAEHEALMRFFIDSDRIPDRPLETKPPAPSDDLLHAAGARLVTGDGFGCTSCHQVGKVIPPAAPHNARGADLSQLGRRVRGAWFDRWVRNPLRMAPRIEMPSIQVPVRGVLHEQLDDQLAAVWHVLNEPGFEPPLPNPVRIVRRSGIEKRQERAVILTDVLTAGKQTWVKPLLVGLPNRHNVLLDLETNRLAGWWPGDTARQRTQGKSWFWEPAGSDVLASGIAGSEVRLVRGGKSLEPLLVGQFPTELDSWEHAPDGLEFRRRLHFPGEQGESLVIRVKESWSSFWFLENLGASGWMRNIEFDGVPAGSSIEFRIVAKERIAADLRDEGGWSLELKGPGETRVEIDMDHDGQVDRAGSVVLQGEDDSPTLDLKLDYITKLPVDEFPVEPPPPPVLEPAALDIVPGYEAVRLPLSDEIMPTAFAWRPDGALVVASLKGQVFLAQDKNRDGLAETLVPFSDELAAPYGLLAEGDHIDVVTKYALLRLFDDDGDGQADRTCTLASGWGHTADYHDWVIGIERDSGGNRFLAIPCQQDKRSAAAAHLRGRVVKLVPRQPDENDPRVYRLEEVSAGHRFPMGIARSRAGELFVTDNQGNYNPFNELNHVVPGARYGFFNALERPADFPAPPMPAAIEIPHPWTRSVNGICFLVTPNREESDFGPFEGHLIGCEYDTRRLIRMSLQRVGETFQGACYPFNYDTPRDGQSLLGPLTCAVSPRGELYIGCVRDSGWGGANNIGAVTRLRPLEGKLPAGIAEIRATKSGFAIDFTQAVDARLAADSANYSVASYRRISTSAYGGPDVDRRNERLDKISLSTDARRVTLDLPELREGFVYELRLKNLAGQDLAGKVRAFHPAEAYYTLRKVPR